MLLSNVFVSVKVRMYLSVNVTVCVHIYFWRVCSCMRVDSRVCVCFSPLLLLILLLLSVVILYSANRMFPRQNALYKCYLVVVLVAAAVVVVVVIVYGLENVPLLGTL